MTKPHQSSPLYGTRVFYPGCVHSFIIADKISIFYVFVKLNHFFITFQTCVLGLTRSDYMVDYASSDRELRLRQIEINTIASGMCGLGQDRIRNLHQ